MTRAWLKLKEMRQANVRYASACRVVSSIQLARKQTKTNKETYSAWIYRSVNPTSHDDKLKHSLDAFL
jgi:hypothetical protein